jgi:hypothetical protein
MKALLGVCVVALIAVATYTLTKKDKEVADFPDKSIEKEGSSVAKDEAPIDDGGSEKPFAEKEATDVTEEQIAAAKLEEPDQKTKEAPNDLGGWAKDYKEPTFTVKKDDRFIMGPGGKALDKAPEHITMSGKPAVDWAAKALERLNEDKTFSSKGDATVVSRNKKFLLIDGPNGIPVEKAHVKFTAPDGSKGSFDAYVNSSTGEIVMAFNGLRDGKSFQPGEAP